MEIERNILRNLLRNVYFINGTAYAGKSTMVKLLADKHEGICCGENYHMELLALADPVHQPNLCYFDTMADWQEFIGRTPEEYEAWTQGVRREVVQLELIKLIQLIPAGKKIFVDTNISPDILREISDYHHVAIMLSPQWMSVELFFNRPDAEKQFLYQKIQEAPNPKAAMANFRSCIERVNDDAHYREFSESGFFTHVRTESSTVEDTLRRLEAHFKLN